MIRILSIHLLPAGCILLVTLIYTWPLVTRLTTAIPGGPADHDVASFVWNIGYVRHALDTGASLWQTDGLLVPFGADLRLHTYGLLQGILAYPFTGWLGVVGAYNLIVIGSIFANGVSIYYLVRREVRQELPSLIAAIWVMLGWPMVFHFLVGRPPVGSVWVSVGALLALRGVLNHPRWMNSLTLAIFYLAALFTDFQIVLYTFLWQVMYGVCRLWCDRRAILDWRRVLGLGAPAAVFVIAFVTIFYPTLTANGYALPSLEDMRVYSLQVWNFVIPRFIPITFGGFGLWASAIAGAIFFRRLGYSRWWLVASVICFILSLGPYLAPTNLPLPFAVFGSLWPPLRHFRTPYRLAQPALIGLGVVAGFVLSRVQERLYSRLLIGVTAFVAIASQLLFTVTTHSFQVQEYPRYTFYRDLAGEQGDFKLLEVPFGVRSGLERIGRGGEVLQYYQHLHGKPIMNGFVARLPTHVFEIYRSHPSLLFLSGDDVATDDRTLREDFAAVLDWSEARYVLLHHDLLEPDQASRIEAFLDRQPNLVRVEIEGDLTIYAVVPSDAVR